MKSMKFGKCVYCLLYGIHFKPNTDEERKIHHREKHKVTKGMSNIGNANGVHRRTIRKEAFQPKGKEY